MRAHEEDLLSFEAALSLSIDEVKELYQENINPPLVEILSAFGPGQELATHAIGVTINTDQGEILDLTGGLGVLNHGHNHPKIIEVRQSYQTLKLMEPHKNHFCPFAAALAKNLDLITPEPLKISFFCNSGAEAVDGALKIAFKAFSGSRSRVLHSDRSFHGKTIGAGSISGADSFFDKSNSGQLFPEIPGVSAYKFNDIDSIVEIIEETRKENGETDIYAIFVEPFSASTVSETSTEFLQRTREICDKENIVLVFDEICTGFAKTGPLFNFMRTSISPDVLTISKSLGGGKSSISAYVTTKALFNKAYGSIQTSLMHSTTYNGFGEECATACEAISIAVQENFEHKAKCIGGLLEEGLDKLQQKFPDIINEYRGSGALYGVTFKPQTKMLRALEPLLPKKYKGDDFFFDKVFVGSIVDHLYRNHNCMTYLTQNREVILYIAPSLVIDKENLEHFFGCLEATLEQGAYKLVTAFIRRRFGF